MDAGVNEIGLAIQGPSGNLAAILTWPASGEAEQGILICSPSSLFGGDMENNVVESLARSAAERGYAALRFDYRNAGKSDDATDGAPRFEWWYAQEESGSFDAALEDARAAHRAGRKYFRPVGCVGYSFGAWVAWQTALRERLPLAVAICPPLSRLDFTGMGSFGPSVLLVVGGADELDPPLPREELAKRFPDARVLSLADASHFLLGEEARAAAPALAFVAARAEMQAVR